MAPTILRDTIESNWINLNEKVSNIAEENGTRPPKIIVVSKTRSIEEIQTAYDIGIKDFGENYAQELENKSKILPNANWHYIGHLQRGNAKKITPFCKFIHTLDSIKLARRLAHLSYEGELFIQIKLATEISKSGIVGEDSAILELLEESQNLGLKVTGLMGVGGLNWGHDQTLIEYLKLNDLRDKLGLQELSLGMSGDYRIAIKAGSTMIRIGTMIFGPRNS